LQFKTTAANLLTCWKTI